MAYEPLSLWVAVLPHYCGNNNNITMPDVSRGMPLSWRRLRVGGGGWRPLSTLSRGRPLSQPLPWTPPPGRHRAIITLPGTRDDVMSDSCGAFPFSSKLRLANSSCERRKRVWRAITITTGYCIGSRSRSAMVSITILETRSTQWLMRETWIYVPMW